MKNDRKTVIVTGGSGGIGSGICLKLSEAWNVVVHYNSDAKAADSVVEQIESRGGYAICVQGDLSEEEAVVKLFDAADAEFGDVHAVIANSGIGGGSAVEHSTLTDFRRLLDINVVSAFLTLREAARRLVDGGSIVFVSSQLAERPREGTGLYSASKAAIDAMLVSMSRELGDREIRVNSVRPGATEPGMFAKSEEERKEFFRNLSPFKRLGHPDDTAGVVAFLVGDDSCWMTGQHLRVDGGASN